MKRTPPVVFFALAIVTSAPAESDAPLGKNWPSVSSLKQEILVKPGTVAAAALYIFRTDGQPLYLVECHDASYSMSHDTDYDYSGDFECRLKPLGSTTNYSTLFTDNPKQHRDWESRARFLAEELLGNCAMYPDYGALREFRLRGMKITLTMDNISFADELQSRIPKLKAFRFGVEVVSDISATSEIAAPSPYLSPHRARLDCTTIKKR